MLNYKIIVFFITWNKVRICIGIGVSEQSQKKIPVISCCSGDKQFSLKTFFFLNHDLQVDKPNHNLPFDKANHFLQVDKANHTCNLQADKANHSLHVNKANHNLQVDMATPWNFFLVK